MKLTPAVPEIYGTILPRYSKGGRIVKKLISLYIICLLCFCQIVSAAPEVSFVSDSRALDIEGVASSGEVVTIIVTKPGIADSALTNVNASESLVLLYELTANQSGTYSGKFTLPASSSSGEYTVYEGNGSFAKFYYADSAEIEECINAVNSAAVSDLTEVFNRYTNTKKILGLDLTGLYSSYTSSSNNIFKSLINAKKAEQISDIKSYFEKSVEAAQLAQGSKTVVLSVLESNTLGISVSSSLDKNSVVDMYLKLRSTGISGIDDISLKLRQASAICSVNTSTKGKITDVLTEYNDVLNLPLSGSYASLDKVEVNKYLYQQNFDSIEKIRTAFTTGVNAVSGAKPGNQTHQQGPSSPVGGGNTISKVEVSSTPSVVSPAGPASSFSDISEAQWAEDYINELASKNIINGVGGNLFAPNRNVTREEYLKMLLSAFGVNAQAADTLFTDVDASAWYAPYVSEAVKLGIVTGISDTAFGTGSSITREQMAVMTVRMLEYTGKKLNAEEVNFTDFDAISQYALDAVSKLCALDIINGMPDGSFAPGESLTRAQAAKVISLIMKVGA